MATVGSRGPKPDAEVEGWESRQFRIDRPAHTSVTRIASALGVTMDTVARIALRAYAREHDVDLPGGHRVRPIEASKYRPGLVAKVPPQIWMRIPKEWMPLLEGLKQGEIRSLAGVVREALRHFERLDDDERRREADA